MNIGFPPPRRPLSVLWTLPYVPYPATNGGKLRQLGLLTQMARRGHSITLLCLTKQMPDAAKRRRADFVIPTGMGKPLALRRLKAAVRVMKSGA